MKVHKITVYVVDFENYGAEECGRMIESEMGLCNVMSTETRDLGQWEDAHPLNMTDTCVEAAEKIFS